MNSGELEKYIGQFDDYLDGNLSATSLIELQKKLDNNPELKAALGLHIDARANVRLAGEKMQKKYFLSKLNSGDEIIEPRKSTSKKPLWMAIGILYLIAFLLLLYVKRDRIVEPPTLSPMAYLEDPNPQLLRSESQTVNSTWDEAIASYLNKDYKKAITFFSVLMKDEAFVEKHGGKLNLYNGIAFTRLGEYNRAINLFQGIPSDNPFYDQAQWYEAITYLISEENVKAINSLKEIVATKNHYKHDEASSLLESIQ